MLFSCSNLIADFVYVLEKGEVLFDKGGLGVWLDGLELGDDPVGCILASRKAKLSDTQINKSGVCS